MKINLDQPWGNLDLSKKFLDNLEIGIFDPYFEEDYLNNLTIILTDIALNLR